MGRWNAFARHGAVAVKKEQEDLRYCDARKVLSDTVIGQIRSSILGAPTALSRQ
jgi:hypothetical protein